MVLSTLVHIRRMWWVLRFQAQVPGRSTFFLPFWSLILQNTPQKVMLKASLWINNMTVKCTTALPLHKSRMRRQPFIKWDMARMLDVTLSLLWIWETWILEGKYIKQNIFQIAKLDNRPYELVPLSGGKVQKRRFLDLMDRKEKKCIKRLLQHGLFLFFRCWWNLKRQP